MGGNDKLTPSLDWNGTEMKALDFFLKKSPDNRTGIDLL
jgi:hypothetical protein